jgi:hypothetical protein
MNFIFGVILLAMFILALRVIWATALQLLGALKNAAQMLRSYQSKRQARHRLPVIMPRSREDMDWLAISDSVRQEIQTRNHGVNREAVRSNALEAAWRFGLNQKQLNVVETLTVEKMRALASNSRAIICLLPLKTPQHLATSVHSALLISARDNVEDA